jgi:hypothetical protein
VDQHPQLRHIATEDLRDFITQATAILKAIHERGDRKSAERLLVQERIPLILKPYRIPPSLIPQCLALTDQPKETLWFQFINLTLKREGLKRIVPYFSVRNGFIGTNLKCSIAPPGVRTPLVEAIGKRESEWRNCLLNRNWEFR